MTTQPPAFTGRPAAPAGHTAAAGQPASGGYPRRWLAAIVMIVGALMDMIDVTIVNVALPTIRRDLHASATQLEWVVSGYMLAFGAALIIAGNLGDLLGRKRVFLFGVAMFGLASLAAAARWPVTAADCAVIFDLLELGSSNERCSIMDQRSSQTLFESGTVFKRTNARRGRVRP